MELCLFFNFCLYYPGHFLKASEISLYRIYIIAGRRHIASFIAYNFFRQIGGCWR